MKALFNYVCVKPCYNNILRDKQSWGACLYRGGKSRREYEALGGASGPGGNWKRSREADPHEDQHWK
ncbi:hypothetical protein GCM10010129_84110 [Streptomyces fumigatiscleroticus]|nr:hypothetical protein GCM10010129_84110 [Streptomyces fumigatiscleroticus]